MTRRKRAKSPPFSQDAFLRDLAGRDGEVKLEIQELIDRIAAIVRAHAPLDLLAKCHLYMLGIRAGKIKETEAWTDDLVALRLPEYVQSLVVSTSPTGNAEITGPDFKELVHLIEQLYLKLTLEFAFVQTAQRKSSLATFDPALEALRTQQHMRWLAVRGHRYSVHDFRFLRRFLMVCPPENGRS